MKEEYDYYTGLEADNMTPSDRVVRRSAGTVPDLRWTNFDPTECNQFGCKEKRGAGWYCVFHQIEFDGREI